MTSSTVLRSIDRLSPGRLAWQGGRGDTNRRGSKARPACLQRRHPEARLVRDDQGCEDHVAHVLAFIETPTRNLDLPVDVRGTAFQQKVWRAVRAIPFGRTSTFTEIARKVGRPRQFAQSGMLARTIRSSSPFPATACSAATAPFQAGPLGGDRHQRTLVAREANATGEKP